MHFFPSTWFAQQPLQFIPSADIIQQRNIIGLLNLLVIIFQATIFQKRSY